MGDIGYCDEDGYYFLTGRSADTIISGGTNIYPQEIDNVLFMNDKVAEVCCVGVPNEEWGEEIKAVIQLNDGIKGDDKISKEILEFSSKHLARMKLPKSIDYLKELPRDPNGKLYKRRLRDPYWKKKK